MYPLQDNIDNSVHESNFTGFINETTATTTTHAESISNRSDISVVNNDYFPAAHTTNSLNYNNYNQSIPQSTSKNNDIISPGHNYQQPTFNDFSNNNFNISPNNKYHQQSMSSPRQFHSQYIDQNPPQTNVFPSLNSPGIVINSPQTYVIIMPVPVANRYSSTIYLLELFYH
ncbi:hypothetical protein RhiirA4_470792 [Rhizophagus irregularis]|uniref:Uncharacterized protein n=1 Tax=Rhizophagus irregularis TaxID=588596 RepID=A0A2I1H1Y5_9GLOM|nr:hypothetical protein RhiirA4_470792 [Rhizophagus irregularis]